MEGVTRKVAPAVPIVITGHGRGHAELPPGPGAWWCRWIVPPSAISPLTPLSPVSRGVGHAPTPLTGLRRSASLPRTHPCPQA